MIGPGALGGAIIDLISRHNDFSLHSVWGREQASSYFVKETTYKLPADEPFPTKDEDLGNLVIMSVPDDQIADLAYKLSETGISWSNRSVIHLSGSHDNTVLDPLANKGVLTATLHPLQTFTRGDKADRFDGIWFSLHGNDSLFPLLNQLIEPFYARSKVLTSEQKSAMHLAAVFASNYLVSLMDVVEQITLSEGIPDGLTMLEPIVHQTIQNIFEKGPKHSLSGPVARGDRSTVLKHLKQLEDNPEYYKLYQQLGLIAFQIAEASGQAVPSDIMAIRDIFESESDSDE